MEAKIILGWFVLMTLVSLILFVKNPNQRIAIIVVYLLVLLQALCNFL